jgi:hypothetical protein
MQRAMLLSMADAAPTATAVSAATATVAADAAATVAADAAATVAADAVERVLLSRLFVFSALCARKFHDQYAPLHTASIRTIESIIIISRLYATSHTILQTVDRCRGVDGNDACCDCGEKTPVWASLNLGRFHTYASFSPLSVHYCMSQRSLLRLNTRVGIPQPEYVIAIGVVLTLASAFPVQSRMSLLSISTCLVLAFATNHSLLIPSFAQQPRHFAVHWLQWHLSFARHAHQQY